MSAPTLEWSDELGPRSRAAWLLLVKGDEVTAFAGRDLPGLVAVRGSDFRRNGKWSHTTYRLLLAPGVRAISGRNGFETGTFAEGLRSAVRAPAPIDTWAEMAAALGVSVPGAMAFLRAWRPKAAEALDIATAKVAEALDAAEEAASSDLAIETVTVSFGAPTKRQAAAGFWTAPKAVPGHPDAEVYLVNPDAGWTAPGNVALRGANGAVTSVRHSSGHGGGYVTVAVSVVRP